MWTRDKIMFYRNIFFYPIHNLTVIISFSPFPFYKAKYLTVYETMTLMGTKCPYVGLHLSLTFVKKYYQYSLRIAFSQFTVFRLTKRNGKRRPSSRVGTQPRARLYTMIFKYILKYIFKGKLNLKDMVKKIYLGYGRVSTQDFPCLVVKIDIQTA